MMVIVSGSAALLCSWRSRPSSTWDACRILNFGGAIGLHGLFRALVKPLQKSPSRARKCFQVLSSLLPHGIHHEAKDGRDVVTE